MNIEIVGLAFSIILGTIGHFLYDLANKNIIIGFFFSKNESIFEHLKLGITPILLWTIIELLTFKSLNILFAKFICILVFIFCLLVFYFAYKSLFKKNILFLDILIFYISLTFAYLVSINLILLTSFSLFLNFLGIIGLSIIIVFYIIFN